jgi:hypothetical protein
VSLFETIKFVVSLFETIKFVVSLFVVSTHFETTKSIDQLTINMIKVEK